MIKNKPRRLTENHRLVHTVNTGPVLADIFRGITPDGHAYLYFVLSRVWRPQSSVRENYSNRFYERHELQVVETAGKASEWIRANPRAADLDHQPRADQSPDGMVAPTNGVGQPKPLHGPPIESRTGHGREVRPEAA